jgi:hypothetical protein
MGVGNKVMRHLMDQHIADMAGYLFLAVAQIATLVGAVLNRRAIARAHDLAEDTNDKVNGHLTRLQSRLDAAEDKLTNGK